MQEILQNIPMMIGGVCGLGVLGGLATGYVKAPTDKAYVISGLRKTPKILVGRAGIKIPFLERKDELLLKVMAIDVKTASSVPTSDYINIRVDSNVNIQIGTSEELLKLACKNFLNKSEDYITSIVREVLEGNVREIVGQLKLETLVSDRKMFADKVKENAQPDLEALGIIIQNFNVQNFIDENGVIENLGIDNIVSIRKKAEISKANATKEIAQAKSKAEQEANDARVLAETQIQEKNTELELRKAKLKTQEETERAKADIAYQIEEEQQRKQLETVTADADIEKQEKIAVVRAKEAVVKERELDANIRKQADADFYRRQKEVEIKALEEQKQADVEQYRAKKEYEILKDKAEAELIAKQKEADGITAVGRAEAEAIKATLLAEAEGLDKKAEAMAKLQSAGMLELIMNKMPEMIESATKPLENIGSITMYGDGNNTKMVKDIMGTVDQVSNGLGFDFKTFLGGLIGSSLGSKGE